MVQENVEKVSHQHAGTISQNIFLEEFIRSFQLREFICGCGAAFINIGVTYPVYKLIFRQMLHGVTFTSAFGQLRQEGLWFLYRGMFPPLAQKTVSLSIMFGVYDGTKRFLVENFNVQVYSAKVLAGVASGSVEACLLPFERVQTLLAHSKFHKHFSNTPGAFKYVLANYGFKELYRGLVPVLWRNGPSNAMFFVMREELSVYLPPKFSMPTHAVQQFVAGALIGASISTIFYPFNVIKVAMQSDVGHKSESMWTTCNKIYVERGRRIRNFYHGCFFNSCRSFMSWGIIHTAYENLRKILS